MPPAPDLPGTADLTLRQLRAIVAVAEERSFTGAGRRLRLSQQSVSALIREVERRLGTRLFDRTTRSVGVTAEGEALVADLRKGLSSIDDALRRTRKAALSEPPLVLAITPAIAYGQIGVLLEALDRDAPIELDVREVWADEMAAGLLEGRFEMAISVEPPSLPGLEAADWQRHRIDLLVSEKHRFARAGKVPVSRLDGTTLVMPGDRTNPGLRDRLLATLSGANVSPTLIDAPRVAGPAPVPVERDDAATIWLTGMGDRFIPKGLVRVPLCDPETPVMTRIVAHPITRSRCPAARAAIAAAIARTSSLAHD